MRTIISKAIAATFSNARGRNLDRNLPNGVGMSYFMSGRFFRSMTSTRNLRWVLLCVVFQVIVLPRAAGQNNNLKLCRLKYNGGGDWYSSRTALPNLCRYANSHIGTSLATTEATAEVGSTDIFRYPFCFLTGHGNVVFSDQEASNLRTYLIAGGFLHICDNYGMDPFIRREMKKVFPELTFQVVPFNHPIYQGPFTFNSGLPKVHQHDGKAPIGYGLFWEGRLVCFYDYECDLGNGWEDPEVYKDPVEIREKALKMGCNLIYQAFIAK